MSNPPNNMLVRKQVADRLSISLDTLDRNMKDPAWRVRIGAKRIGKSWRFIYSRVELMATSTSY